MKKLYLNFISTVFTAALLAACGGGGGSDGGGTSGTSGITYTGPTSAAPITGANANTLAKTALFSNSATGVSVFKTGATSSNTAADTTLAAMIKTLSRLPQQINLNKTQVTQASRAVFTPPAPITGSCGGSFTYSFNVDDTTGSFTGSLIFSSFCEDVNNVINGTITASGTVDVNTEEFISFSMTFSSLSINDAGTAMTFNGTMTVSFPDVNTTLFTMSMDATDSNGVSVRINNFAVQTTDNGTYETISVSGRFFHSQYGYVNLSTLTPMNVTLIGDYPYSGVLLLTGANGTRAQLTFAAANNYVLEVDADGNGSFELIGNCNWAQTCTPAIPVK